MMQCFLVFCYKCPKVLKYNDLSEDKCKVDHTIFNIINTKIKITIIKEIPNVIHNDKILFVISF